VKRLVYVALAGVVDDPGKGVLSFWFQMTACSWASQNHGWEVGFALFSADAVVECAPLAASWGIGLGFLVAWRRATCSRHEPHAVVWRP
jgi:dipeptide/tripeptide permease